MKFASTVFGLVTAAALSSTAFAADLPARVVKPGIAPAAACFWAGPYVGAQAGYTFNSVKTNYLDINGAIANSSHNKITGGVYAGYNFCLTPNFIAGVEVEATKYGNAPKHDARLGVTQTFSFNHFDTNYGGSAVLRLGMPVNRALLYVKGGVGVAQQSAYNFIDVAGVATGVRASKTNFGFVVGAGVDYAFTNNIIGRLGYTYFDGGKISVPGGGRWSTSYHTVNVGVAYKF